MRRWGADLVLGMGLAVAGRGARLRAGLTAAGIAFAVTLLLGAAAVPHAIAAHDRRTADRQPTYAPGRGRLLMLSTDTSFQGRAITGQTVQATAPHPPLPPGVARIPAPGEMVVSPALAATLRGGGGAALGRRLHARVVGMIGDRGLSGPAELIYYRGATGLAARGAPAVTGFGVHGAPAGQAPVVTVLVIVMIMALLTPVAVFVMTAARFGSDDRDRRLAALRLVGADRAATARIAAGETGLGAAGGVLLGVLLFIALRPLAPQVAIGSLSVFAADLRPAPGLAALVLVGVPALAILSTVLAMRRVAAEPLGVSRRGRPVRRRLWWRLGVPVAGFALLVPLMAAQPQLDSASRETQIGVGVGLALIGLTALLPWFVEALVRRAPDGPLAWLLAIRRLRSAETTTGRVVAAIGLAVAGAIALQMLFSAADNADRVATGLNTSRGSLLVAARATSTDGGVALAGRLRAVAGVARVTAVTEAGADTAAAVTVTVAPCAMLTAIAEVGNCRDGDAFVVTGNGRPPAQRSLARLLGSAGASALSRARRVPPVTDPSELPTDAVLLTPGAAGPRLRADSLTALIALRPGDGGAEDRLRDAVAQIDPLATVTTLTGSYESPTLTGISHVLLAGTVAILLMIGASLLVAAVEQLRERRGALAALAAAGTRRSTLAWSVTWQTAIPMAIGLALAVALGTTLGGVLMAIVHLRVSIDWTAIGVLVGAGALVVTGASLLTVPLLWRLAGPDELRAE